MYHALVESYEVERVESAEKMNLQIEELTLDSEHVCEQLSLSNANCGKLEEALRVAQKDDEFGRNEAQDFHMRLIASQKEVKRLEGLNLDANRVTMCNLKRLERLGVREEELMQACKLNTQASIDLTELLRQNKVLVKKNEAKKPLPQQVPLKNLIKAFPKVHMVGVEDRLQASVAWSQNVAQNAVYTVFESLYRAMEPACDIVADRRTAVEEQVNAKALGLDAVNVLVDGCYLSIYGQTENLKQKGSLPKTFVFRPRMDEFIC